MKKLLIFIVDLTRQLVRNADAQERDETLRANQGSEPASYGVWRALVGK